jgi:hypothetical protein
MKLKCLALLGAFAASSFAAAPVLAQRHVEVERTTTTTTVTNKPGWNHHEVRRHKVCRTHWYHHRKVRRCTWHRWR